MKSPDTASGPAPWPRLGVRLAMADTLAGMAALFLPIWLRYGDSPPPEHLLSAQAWLPVFVVFRLSAAYGFGLYDFRHRLQPADHAFGGLGAAFVGAAPGYLFLAFLQLYYLPLAQFSRVVAVLDMALLALWYGLSRAMVLAWLHGRGCRLRVALAGPAEACAELAGEIRVHAPALVVLAGGFDPARVSGPDDPGIADWLARETPDQVILEALDLPDTALSAVVVACDRRDVEVCIHPGLRLALLAGAEIFSLAGLPLIRLNAHAARPAYAAVKRGMDLSAALGGLVLLSPLLAALALAVRLGSPGPALYRQERQGRGGKPFHVVKFRTMAQGAEDRTGPVLAEEDDPRVTPAGRWLRRTRLDELPQLWNVLRGEMSLVGPRPERPAFADAHLAEEPLYRHRLLARPGMTGLAQIHGRYDTDYRQKLRYDLLYIGNMTLAADLRILAATARIVLTGRGAR